MSRRRRRLAHVNHERWLVSYADFITLLFAFFVVLYSSSQVDRRKVGKLAVAIQVAFQELGVFPASSTTISVDAKEPIPFNTVQAIENAERTAALGRIVPSPKGVLGASESGDLSSLRQELEDALAPEIKRNEIAVSVGPDGLVVSLREIGFFESGSAKIRAASLDTFSRIAWLLAERKYRVRIEGHTDNKPIHNAQFSDNWELSTARATELVRLLITKYGFAPDRLSAAGYAEFHPVANNDSNETRAQNRRVDLVILGRVSPNRLLVAQPSTAPGTEGTSIAAAIARASSAPDKSKPSPATPVQGPTAAQ
jgi:chemotaxis protein MotB